MFSVLVILELLQSLEKNNVFFPNGKIYCFKGKFTGEFEKRT